MSKQFEFRLIGDRTSFKSLLKTYKVTYVVLSQRTYRRFSRGSRSGIPHKGPRTAYIGEIVERFLITLTPFILDKIWNWYNRNRKDSKLSVRCNGNLLDLNRKSKKILMSLLKEASKKQASKVKKLPWSVKIQCPVCGNKLGYDTKIYLRAMRGLIPKSSFLTCPKCKKETMLIYWKNLTRFPKEPIDRRIRGHK